MTLYIIITIAFLFVGWILTLVDDGERNFPYGLIGGFIGVIIPTILLLCVFNEQLKAMDAYQGKTTLEITYKDSVAVDSVVIYYKDNDK